MASTTASEPSPSPPAQPSNDIDVAGISTLVSWNLADGTTEFLQSMPGGTSSSLCRSKLHLIYESESRSALFKLQLSFLLKPQRHKSKNTAQFFIFIPPENIATLSLSLSAAGGQETPEVVRQVLSPDTICLRFSLNAPPTVVAPPAPDRIMPKNERGAGVLASLLDLGRQTNIAIYLPHRALDQARLRTLCTAASGFGLASIAHHGSATLYGGKGDRILEASIIDSPFENGASDATGLPAVDCPPSYDQLGPGPPPAVGISLEKESSAGQPSRKRPRRSSFDPASSPPSPSCGEEGMAKKPKYDQALRETHQRMGTMEKNIEIVEQAEQAAQMEQRIEQAEQRLTARLDRRLDLFEQLVKDQIQEHKRSITEMVEQRMEAHEEQTQTDLDQLRREVESDVEEQLIGKKAELHEQFRDEREELQASLEERFADLEESITERFSSARAVLEFD
ncbi:hypothetical protein VMCG_05675 [Cytospora schulzeri]|uniref:Uncharacterized protein n=1 Tax=Cytospora schulzeri TaxID=448051 RepID=A0A423WHX9_9PEZI|nr:hypothetical protein VMCG_05675 [Valsa malicola]